MKKYRASKLTVKEITNAETKDFLNVNHKQGFITAQACFGLFDGNELLQVETFGFPRIEMQNKTIWHDWELLRECSKKDCLIYGGKSRLLKAFEKKYHPVCLLSYCNETLGFDGHSYNACGFIKEHVAQDYWYEYNGEKIKRYAMQKNKNLREKGLIEPIQKTLEKYGKTYYSDLSEKENAQKAGFVLVKGLGQATWTKHYSDFVGYIYDFEINGKHYVGQHTLYKDGKWNDIHYNGSGVYWLNAVKKYGAKNIKKTVLRWYKSEYVMKKMEMHWIRKMAAVYGKENMYNISYSNDATAQLWRLDDYKNKTTIERMKITKANKTPEEKAETNKKISDSTKLVWSNMTPLEKAIKISHFQNFDKAHATLRKTIDNMTEQERKEKYGKNRGKTFVMSEETKKKISEAQKGKKRRKLSEEHKRKISEKMKGFTPKCNHSKQAETLKARYASGEIKPWNKDEEKAKWLKIFTESTSKSLTSFKRWWKINKSKTNEERLESLEIASKKKLLQH